MHKKKAVFFDIDGTLWNEKNEIPPSAIKAIRRLREKGNLAFLCSGRCRAHIRSRELLGIGFDGIVSGCGTMIEYAGETVFYKRIENENDKCKYISIDNLIKLSHIFNKKLDDFIND